MNRTTIWRILKKLEKYIVPIYYNRIGKLVGPYIVVEIDESKFGKVKYNRGHRIDGVWVFDMVERTP